MNELDIHIGAAGDPSVGIPESHWTVTGGVILEDSDHRELVRSMMADAFGEIVGEKVEVVFSDEIRDEPEYE